MRILNNFSENEIPLIAKQIREIIRNEEDLTKRDIKEIERLLKQSSFYIATENNNICGFIARKRLIGNYYEIKSWYVIPAYRGNGLGDKLFKEATADSQQIYLCATFKEEILNKIKLYNFEQIKLLDLPVRVLIAYITNRSWKSILKHLFINRSYLLIS